LFNIYGECVIRKATEDWKEGISVGGRTINNLRYADDTTLCASNEQELTELLPRVEMASQEAGLTINRSKTKIMIITLMGSWDVVHKKKLRDQMLDRLVSSSGILPTTKH